MSGASLIDPRGGPPISDRRYADAYFMFMGYFGVDPTNSRTEQQVRFVLIGRKVT